MKQVGGEYEQQYFCSASKNEFLCDKTHSFQGHVKIMFYQRGDLLIVSTKGYYKC